ncbi:MAG: flagellar export protein FliJ [Planctomycetia bacterium]|nr:flagellar export protein FliJ [Planctomycetia bacterium]
MAAFKFRLQTLVRIREGARDERREQLAEVLRIDEALQAQLTDLERDRHQARREQTFGVGRVDVDRMLGMQRYEALLIAEIEHVQRQRTKVGEELERRRLALLEADREVRVLEKLREVRLAEYRAETAVAEMKVTDEAAARCVGEEFDR